jgi:hypothetical protein
MAEDRTSSLERVKPIGSDKNFVLALIRRSEGFFYLLALIVEGMLFLIFLVGRTDTERLLALGGFLLFLLVLIFYYSRERGQFHEREMKKLGQPAVPPSMTARPIGAAEAEGQADLRTAPDGTFVYATPPANWKITATTLADDLKQALDQQAMSAFMSGSPEPFRSGPVVLFNESNGHRIEYLPGQSQINGRLAFGTFNEDINEQVRMYSVSKHGGMMRDMSAEHVFGHIVAALIQGGVKIETIRSAPSEVGGRATLTALGTLRLGHARIDGVEIASAAVEVRLHVVEYANFLYVIQTRVVTGIESTEARRSEIGEIVNSFRAASAANAVERERLDAEEAEKSFEAMAISAAPDILFGKAGAVIESIRASGQPRVTPKHLEQLDMLVAYAKAFPKWVPEPVRAALEELRLHAMAALDGEPAALASFLEAVDQGAEEELGPPADSDAEPDAAA